VVHDKVTGSPLIKLIEMKENPLTEDTITFYFCSCHDLSFIFVVFRHDIMSSKGGDDDRRKIGELSDLLEQMLLLDPARRIGEYSLFFLISFVFFWIL